MSTSHLIPPPKPATGALLLETYELTKRFGSFTAMDSVTMTVEPGTVHALLGENGAGKSTFVKCVVGYYRPDDGAVMVDGRERDIHAPTVARDLGIGAQEAFEKITDAVGTAREKTLKQIGITIDLDTAYKDLAQSLNKTVKELTDAEKRQAFLNATLDEGYKSVQRYNLETLTLGEQIQKIKTLWESVKDFAGEVAIRTGAVIGGVIAGLTTLELLIVDGFEIIQVDEQHGTGLAVRIDRKSVV